MRWVITFVVVAAALGASSTACKKSSTEASEGTAKAAVKPGTHEDWCDEHAVPESQCSKCNPSLIPAFKATGDWCDLHKMPKSHDLECDPKLKITRPPKT